jgi:hypothetical protein
MNAMPSKRILAVAGIMAAALLPATMALADERDSLEADMQDVKRLALEMHRDLIVTQDTKVFPEETQVDIFISMDIGVFFDVQSVKVVVDGAEAGEQAYSRKQARALTSGATQKIFVGNLSEGKHELTAIVSGVGRHYPIRRGITLNLDKKPGTQVVNIRLSDGEDRQDLALVAKVTP